MSKNHRKICVTLTYFEQVLILASIFAGCKSISVFDSLFVFVIEVMNSAVICPTTAGTIIIQKKMKKHDKTVKTKSISKKVLISNNLIDSNVVRNEFIY